VWVDFQQQKKNEKRKGGNIWCMPMLFFTEIVFWLPGGRKLYYLLQNCLCLNCIGWTGKLWQYVSSLRLIPSTQSLFFFCCYEEWGNSLYSWRSSILPVLREMAVSKGSHGNTWTQQGLMRVLHRRMSLIGAVQGLFWLTANKKKKKDKSVCFKALYFIFQHEIYQQNKWCTFRSVFSCLHHWQQLAAALSVGKV